MYVCTCDSYSIHVQYVYRLCSYGTFVISEASEGLPMVMEAESWVWLLDLERSVALVIGRCLGGMLQGTAPSVQENSAEFWLQNPLLRNGLEMDLQQLGTKPQSCIISSV